MTHSVRFMGVNRDTATAGPGKRLELFTKGCIRGVVAPCQGCFNESTWTFAGPSRDMTIDDIIDVCLETAWNRQVTFCGGEPILQAKALAEAAKRLKQLDPTFHFVMYTAYKLDTLMKYGLKFTWIPEHGNAMYDALHSYSISHHENYPEGEDQYYSSVTFTILSPEDVKELMQHIDLIVDGDYKQELRLTTSQYMHEGWFIGSSNQRVIDAPASAAAGKLVYTGAADYNAHRQKTKHCRCCGHDIPKSRLFCNSTCASRYGARKKELELIGGI